MTPNPTTISEAKTLKKTLEQGVQNLLNEYTKATGLQIKSLHASPVFRDAIKQEALFQVHLDAQL